MIPKIGVIKILEIIKTNDIVLKLYIKIGKIKILAEILTLRIEYIFFIIKTTFSLYFSILFTFSLLSKTLE